MFAISLIVFRTFQCRPAVENEPEVAILKREDSGECFYDAQEHLEPRTFHLSVPSDYHFDKLSASVKMPSGKKDAVRVKVNFEFSMLYVNVFNLFYLK